MCWVFCLSFLNSFELKIVWFELWAATSKKKRVGADTKKVGQAKKESGGRYKKVVARKKREWGQTKKREWRGRKKKEKKESESK